MGLFFSSDRFTRPGPGVRPDAPRKKGVARLAEIMGRDMWNFFRAGFLAFLGCLPFIIGMFFAVETHALLFMLLAGIIGGLIAGPELSAMADTVLRSLRDEPGYWWETYRRVWKRNARESLLPGMLTGLVLSMQIFTLFHMSVISAGIVTWVLLILSFVVTLGLESYIWPQIALLDLPLYGILKNSLLAPQPGCHRHQSRVLGRHFAVLPADDDHSAVHQLLAADASCPAVHLPAAEQVLYH